MVRESKFEKYHYSSSMLPLKPLSCSQHWVAYKLAVLLGKQPVSPQPLHVTSRCAPQGLTWYSSNTVRVRITVSGHLSSSWGHSTYPSPLPLKSQGSYGHSSLKNYASYSNNFFSSPVQLGVILLTHIKPHHNETISCVKEKTRNIFPLFRSPS